jgi:hypothetical protein
MNKLQVFTSNGTFNVPAGVSCGFVTQSGGGGGANRNPGNAGGASQVCIRMPIKLTPGGILSVIVGAKGGGAKGAAYSNTNGGDSIVGPIQVSGGTAAFAQGGNPSFPYAGFGGGLHGAEGNTFNFNGLIAPQTVGQPGLAINGGQSCIKWWGGSSGGGATGAANPDGNFGGAAVNNNPGGLNGGAGHGGGGGASSFFGTGAQGSTGSGDGRDATSSHYGAGGGGGLVPGSGGDGAGGVVWIEYIMP